MKTFSAAMALCAVLAAPAATAAVSEAEFEAVKQMLEDALERISELEAQQQAVAEPAPRSGEAPDAPAQEAAVVASADIARQVEANTAAIDSMSWAERIRINGDFRYRYENAAVEGPVVDSNGDVVFNDGERNRNRIRARAAIIADLADNVEIGLGVASGGDDPVSSNQTLGGGGSSKDINLDLAYFDWTGLTDTSVRGGKFKRTLKVVGGSQLQWDSDWRPEGFDVAWDNGTYFAQGLGTYLESDSDKDSEFAYMLQAGAQGEVAGIALVAGVGYTEIDAAGSECFFATDDFGQCFGNETDVGGNYLYDFEVYNVFASAGFDLAGRPITLFGDWVRNDAAAEQDSGYLFGAQLGNVSRRGSWHLKAYYEDLEANATLGLLADSDFGGTNRKGWVVEARYGLTDQISTQLRYISTEANSAELPVINNGQAFDVDLAQLDFMFKYK